MPHQGESKTCKMCCEEIAAEAKKCPHCHHWQHRLSMVAYHPLFITLFIFVPMMAVWVFVASMTSTMFAAGERFQTFAGDITVEETKVRFGEDQCGPAVVVIGKIKNLSPVDWKDMRFQVDFFNSKGELVDNGQQEAFTWRLPAGEETSFKVSFRRQFPEQEYASHKVRVISATDSRQRF